MTGGPSRGLPPRIYLPILVVTTLAFLGIVGYFLKVGLGVTGAALGPVAQQGDSNIRVAPSSAPDALASAAPGEVVLPATGGAPNGSGAPNSVGGGTPPQAAAGGPPAPVQRLLTELRGRLQQNPNDLAALVNLANLYFDAGKYDQAIGYYKRALAIDPDNPDTRTDYATALHGEDRDLEKKPDFAEALFNEGVVANAIGRRTQAIAAFRAFLRVAPHDERASDARTALQNLGTS